MVFGVTTTQGHALRVGEERKMVAHHSECQAVGVTFVLLVMETLDGWNEEGILNIKRIGPTTGAVSELLPC